MAPVEEAGVQGLLAWVCDLHSLNSVLASAPVPDAVPDAVPRPPAEPSPVEGSPQWAIHLVRVWSQLAPPASGRAEVGST